MKKYSYIIASLITFCLSAFAVYLSVKNPFGLFFWSKVYLCLFSIAALFYFIGRRCWKCGGWIFKSLATISYLISSIITCLLVLSLIDYRLLYGPLSGGRLNENEWAEDLDYLVEKLPEEHAGIFKLLPKEKYELAVNDLKKIWNALDENGKKVSLLKFVAGFRDGHTAIWPFDPATDFRYFPVSLYAFSDGYYVVDIPNQHSAVKKWRLVSINGIPINEIYTKVKPYLGVENEWGSMDRFQIMGMNANILLHEKIIANDRSAVFTFISPEGIKLNRTIESTPWFVYAYWMFLKPVPNTSPSMITNFRKDWYWYSYDSISRDFYIQVSQTENQNGKIPLDSFIGNVRTKLSSLPINKLIIDLRANRGGNQGLLRPLVDLVKEPAYNQKGKLFIITSRTSYSAAVITTVRILHQTNAILVGEPMGQGYNFYANHNRYPLPHSKMKFNAPPVHMMTSLEEDTVNTIYPDLPVDHISTDYFEGKDPEIEMIRRFKTLPLDGNIHALRVSEIPLSFLQITPKSVPARYLLKDNMILSITVKQGGLWVCINNFNPTGEFNFSQPIYYQNDSTYLTGINDIVLKKGLSGDVIAVDWKGKRIPVYRLPDAFKHPAELIQQGFPLEAVDMLYRNRNFRSPFIEAMLNKVGYDLMKKRNYKDALKVLKANLYFFPRSVNVYDSLGELYLLMNDKESAIKYYRQVLLMDRKNKRVSDILRKNAAE